ncbi:glycosyltransferase [Microbacterium sp. HJ5]
MLRSWSLITVSYNSAPALRRYWSAVRPDHVEWIVVDNGSSDDSVQVAQALGATVIAAGRNLGFSAANNRGLASATGDFIAFVNPDVRVEFDDLQPLSAVVDAVGGLVAPQLVHDDGSLQPNGRGMPVLAHKVQNRLSSGAAKTGYLILAADGETRFVFWAIGAVVAGRAATVRALRGWNERFFVYYEDKDLSLRAWREGYPVAVAGRFRWTHGWARETLRFRLRPWLLELDSLVRFYTLYPELLLGGGIARRRHALASARAGRIAAID